MSAVIILVVLCMLCVCSSMGGGIAWYYGMIPNTYLYNVSKLNEYIEKQRKDDVCNKEGILKKMKELKLNDKAPDWVKTNSIFTDMEKTLEKYSAKCGFTGI